MAILITKTFKTDCNEELLDYINQVDTISPTLEQITTNLVNPATDSDFWFSSALSADELSELDSILSSWACPDTEVFWNNSTGLSEDMGGAIYSFSFVRENTVGNVWLSAAGDGSNYSDKTRLVVPFDSELISISFSNAYYNKAGEIEIWKEDFETVTQLKAYIWSYSNIRCAVNNSFKPIPLNAGDKIGVLHRSKRKDPYRVVITLYLRAITRTYEVKTDNTSGRFKK